MQERVYVTVPSSITFLDSFLYYFLHTPKQSVKKLQGQQRAGDTVRVAGVYRLWKTLYAVGRMRACCLCCIKKKCKPDNDWVIYAVRSVLYQPTLQ